MSVRRGSPEASAAIWRWRDDYGRGDARRARIGGLLRGLVGAAIGGGAFWLGSVHAALVAWGLSGLLTLVALASPLGAHAAVLRVMSALGGLVGLVVGWALLTPVYLLFFVPFRFLFRRGSRDKLTRWIDPNAVSYWEARDEDAPAKSMKRPY